MGDMGKAIAMILGWISYYMYIIIPMFIILGIALIAAVVQNIRKAHNKETSPKERKLGTASAIVLAVFGVIVSLPFWLPELLR